MEGGKKGTRSLYQTASRVPPPGESVLPLEQEGNTGAHTADDTNVSTPCCFGTGLAGRGD